MAGCVSNTVLNNIAYTDHSWRGSILVARTNLPGFVCDYAPDERQAIADSWPRSLDDRVARADWGWQPRFDLTRMTEDMLQKLRARLEAGNL